MKCCLPTNQVVTFATRLLRPIMEDAGWDGEVFLCGGAFKSLVRDGVPVKDLDLWVRNRKEREKLRDKLIGSGCQLKRDFHPYCIVFEKAGQAIEITYQNLNERGLDFILGGCDLGICSAGVQWADGEIVAVETTACFERSWKDGVVHLNDRFRVSLTQTQPASVLRTIDRMESAATELGFQTSKPDLALLWEIYFSMTPPEKRDAVELYLQTMTGYKGRNNSPMMRRACSALTRREPELLALGN